MQLYFGPIGFGKEGNWGVVWLSDSDIYQSNGTKGKAEYDIGFGIPGALGNDFGAR